MKTERKSASDLDVVFSKGPVDLLSSQAMQDLVAELQLKYDYIVVDASPLLAAANPLTLPPITDKMVMIIEWGRTSRTNFSEALKTLSLIGYSIRGIVLNKVDYKRPASCGFGLVQTILMAHAFELLGNTDDLQRRVAPAFTTTAFGKIDIRRRCDRQPA